MNWLNRHGEHSIQTIIPRTLQLQRAKRYNTDGKQEEEENR
jgi:hypothetical protein